MSERRTVITCELPADQRDWRPDPFPGCDTAIGAGCTCPILQPWPGALNFATDCPVHELEHVKN